MAPFLCTKKSVICYLKGFFFQIVHIARVGTRVTSPVKLGGINEIEAHINAIATIDFLRCFKSCQFK